MKVLLSFLDTYARIRARAKVALQPLIKRSESLDLAAAEIDLIDKDGNEIYFHSLRNSYISYLANSNTPPKVVQKLARHSDPRLTFNVYARTFDEAEQKAISFLPNFGNLVLDTCLDKTGRKQEITIDNHRHKNGQDTVKTAFLADKKIGVIGFEPTASWSQTRRSIQAELHPASHTIQCGMADSTRIGHPLQENTPLLAKLCH